MNEYLLLVLLLLLQFFQPTLYIVDPPKWCILRREGINLMHCGREMFIFCVPFPSHLCWWYSVMYQLQSSWFKLHQHCFVSIIIVPHRNTELDDKELLEIEPGKTQSFSIVHQVSSCKTFCQSYSKLAPLKISVIFFMFKWQWLVNIKLLCTSLNFQLRNISRSWWFLDHDTCHLIIQALIFSCMDYGNIYIITGLQL